MKTPPPLTPDRRYIVVRGRLWRAADPNLSPERHEALVGDLMAARRAVGQAKRVNDAAAEHIAHAAVDAAKVALGERGEPWWTDGTPDLNRRMVRNTDYASWFDALDMGRRTGDDRRRTRVGTAGWSIPKDQAHAFPADGTGLARYAAMMTVAEINSSFYRAHRRSTYERWAATTPDDFRFSVKLPKELSHTRKLADPEEPLAAFIDQIGGLAGKLGVVLVQLAPSLEFDRPVVSAFFKALRRRLDPAVEIATEPRHASWFTGQVDAFLLQHGVARVAADPVLVPGGELPGGWTGLRYRRLHGSPRVYYSAYDDAQLAALGKQIDHDHAANCNSWCIFDNTASGAALGDAMKLQSRLSKLR